MLLQLASLSIQLACLSLSRCVSRNGIVSMYLCFVLSIFVLFPRLSSFVCFPQWPNRIWLRQSSGKHTEIVEDQKTKHKYKEKESHPMKDGGKREARERHREREKVII